MPKGNRKAKQRQQKVASEALANEIKKNAEKIPETIPDSALFKEDDDVSSKKKAKIVLHPRPELERKTKKLSTDFSDIWGDEKPENVEKVKTKKYSKVKASLPTSAESYTSSSMVTTQKKTISEVLEPNEPSVTLDPAEEIEASDSDDGIVDCIRGQKPSLPEQSKDLVVPEKKKKERKDLILVANLPSHMPLPQKMELRKMLKENNKIYRERKEKELEPEFERIDETAKEVNARLEEISNREKKAKAPVRERFIADEPLYEMEKVPENMSEISGDQRQFARLQMSLERRGIVPLHE